MDWRSLCLIVGLELRGGRRNRWVWAILLSWLLLGAALAWSATPAHLAGWQGWERTSAALLPALLLVLPLAAMLTAIHATTGEASTWEFLMGQPLHPRDVLGGKLLAAWLMSTLGLMTGVLAAFTVAWVRGAGGRPASLLVVLGAGVLLAAAFVTMGGWVASGATRLSALGLGVGVWVGLVFLYDFLLMGVAVTLSGTGAVLALLALLVLNPLDSARLAVLTALGLHEGLGPTGLALAQAGRWGMLAPWALLALWSLLALLAALRRWQAREGYGGL